MSGVKSRVLCRSSQCSCAHVVCWKVKVASSLTDVSRGFVASLLQYLGAKNYQNTMQFDRVIANNKCVSKTHIDKRGGAVKTMPVLPRLIG